MSPSKKNILQVTCTRLPRTNGVFVVFVAYELDIGNESSRHINSVHVLGVLLVFTVLARTVAVMPSSLRLS